MSGTERLTPEEVGTRHVRVWRCPGYAINGNCFPCHPNEEPGGYDVGLGAMVLNQRSLTLRLDVGKRLWPRWRYNGVSARVELLGYDLRASVPAARFSPRELAAIRQAEEVLEHPTPLLLANLVEQLSELTPLRWRCGRPVDVGRVARWLRGRAILS